MAQPFSVADILANTSQLIGQISEDDIRATGNFSRTTAVMEQEQMTQQSAAKDAITQEAAKQAGDLNRQKNVADFMTAIDFEANKQRLATKLNQQTQALEELGASIEKDQSVGFLDNPIAWLGAQITVAPKIERYNAVVDSYNATADHLSTLNSATQQVAATELATMQTVTADSAAAASRLAGVQYITRSHEAAIKALANDTAQIKFLRDSDIQKIELQANARRVIQDERAAQLREESFEMQKKSFNLQMQREARLAKKEQREEEFQDNMVAMANLGARHNNSRTFSSVNDFKMFAQRYPDQAQQLISIGYDISEKVQKGEGGTVMVGSSVGDAALLLATTRGSLSSPVMDNFVKSAYNTALAPRADGSVVDAKKPAEVRAAVTAAANAAAKRDQEDIRNGDGNIYRPPTWTELLTTLGSDAKLPAFYQKVLAAEVRNNPSALVDPQVLFSRGVQSVVAGTAKFEEVVQGIQQIAKAAGETNNAVRNYDAIGVPTQKSYTTKVKVHPNNMYNRSVDFYDYAQLSNAVALATATARRTVDLPLDRQIALPPAVNAAAEVRDSAVGAAGSWLLDSLQVGGTSAKEGAK